MRKSLLIMATLLVVVLIFTGCGSDNDSDGVTNETPVNDNTGNDNSNDANNEEEEKEIVYDKTPVTIQVWMGRGGYLSEEEFDQYITEPVKEQYPWIDVEHVYGSLEQMVAANEIPDIMINNNITRKINELTDLGLAAPITDLIEKYNVDLDRFEPETLEAIKRAMQRDELTGLPYTRHFDALYYNKDIFNRFGVDYPTDGMTWDEVYELAREVNRKEDGIQFQGFKPNVIERPASQLSIDYVDPETNESLIHSDPFKKVLETMVKIHQIPGNEDILFHSRANNAFSADRTVAMLAGANILYDADLDKVEGMDWDIVQLPTWPEAPDVGYRIDEHLMSVTSVSDNRDAAFLILLAVTSDEVQMDMSKNGRLSILKNPEIHEAFGSEMDFMEGKNIEAIFKNTPAKTFNTTRYDGISFNHFNGALREVINEGVDVNTALRNAEESINQIIKEKEAGR